MKKKAIERIPYIGLKKNIRPKTVKYIGITAIRIVGHEKHLFLEVYRNAKNQTEPVVRVVLNKKEFGTYIPETGEWNRRQIMSDECYDPYLSGIPRMNMDVRRKNWKSRTSFRARKIWRGSKNSAKAWRSGTALNGGSTYIAMSRTYRLLPDAKRKIEDTNAARMPSMTGSATHKNCRRRKSWKRQTVFIFIMPITCTTRNGDALHR